jgi:diguanylate cyclase
MSLLQKQDDQEADYKKNEQQLCRTIVRLTLATGGLNPSLDHHLENIRNVVRKGELDQRAYGQLSTFSEALLRAQDDTPPPTARREEKGRDSDLFQRIVSRSRLKGRDAGRLNRIAKQFADDPSAATDDKIDELLALLAKDYFRDEEQGEEKPGFLGRLLGRDAGGDEQSEEKGGDDGGSLRHLLALLAKLNWPEQLKEDVTALEGKLGGRQSRKRWRRWLTPLPLSLIPL